MAKLGQGVVFAIVKDGFIQLEKRLKVGSALYGYYIVPGGKMDPGEKEKRALVREVEEEYNVIVSKCKKLGVIESEVIGGVSTRHIYMVTNWLGELKNPEAMNEHCEATLTEARKLCKHPITQQILDLVEAELLRQNG